MGRTNDPSMNGKDNQFHHKNHSAVASVCFSTIFQAEILIQAGCQGILLIDTNPPTHPYNNLLYTKCASGCCCGSSSSSNVMVNQSSLTLSLTSVKEWSGFCGLKETVPNLRTSILKHGKNNIYSPANIVGTATSHPSNCKTLSI